jgi:hypothetical protein
MHYDRLCRSGHFRRLAVVRPRCRGRGHGRGGESASYRGCCQARPSEACRTVKDGPPGRIRTTGALCRAIIGLIRVDL